jgi:hypothetical protein
MELAPICRIFLLFHSPDARLVIAQQAETTWLINSTNIADSLLCSFLSSVRRRRTEGVNFIN